MGKLGDQMAGKAPTYDRLMNPLLRALKALGGSGSIEEYWMKYKTDLQALESLRTIDEAKLVKFGEFIKNISGQKIVKSGRNTFLKTLTRRLHHG